MKTFDQVRAELPERMRGYDLGVYIENLDDANLLAAYWNGIAQECVELLRKHTELQLRIDRADG